MISYRCIHLHRSFRRFMTAWCTIRTFSEHAIELGNEPSIEPIFFIKPSNCVHIESDIPISSLESEIHYETECVLRLGGDGKPTHLMVGLDLTDRQRQTELKNNQLPWARAKCFRASAILGNPSPLEVSVDELSHPDYGFGIRLQINAKVVQHALLSQMSITPRQQLDALMRWAPIEEGDYLFTGTPKGVGRLNVGDHILAEVFRGDGVIVSRFEGRCV